MVVRGVFHGAYATRRAAIKKARAVHGFIRRVTIYGTIRWVVRTGKRQ